MSAEQNTLVLASGSPRRRRLLASLGVPFEVIPSDVPEQPKTGERASDFVARVAREKGESVAGLRPEAWVLSADTIVVLDGEVFGKPRDRGEAVRMLERLSGRRHSVFTAVSMIRAGAGVRLEAVEETRVWFRALDRQEIESYVSGEDVTDKAGAYAIQGAAAAFIPRIEGDYENVVGLPLELTRRLLLESGFTCPTS